LSDTIFGKILRGEIPAHKIYEDDLVVAILDVFPVSIGHTLVIPKEAAATLDLLSDESAAAIGRVLPRVCRAVMSVSGSVDYNILQNNGSPAHQAIFHVHFHVIAKIDENCGLGIQWPARKLAGGEALAEKMRLALGAGSRT
jgi:histidine triad (HIT) family protein